MSTTRRSDDTAHDWRLPMHLYRLARQLRFPVRALEYTASVAGSFDPIETLMADAALLRRRAGLAVAVTTGTSYGIAIFVGTTWLFNQLNPSAPTLIAGVLTAAAVGLATGVGIYRLLSGRLRIDRAFVRLLRGLLQIVDVTKPIAETQRLILAANQNSTDWPNTGPLERKSPPTEERIRKASRLYPLAIIGTPIDQLLRQIGPSFALAKRDGHIATGVRYHAAIRIDGASRGLLEAFVAGGPLTTGERTRNSAWLAGLPRLAALRLRSYIPLCRTPNPADLAAVRDAFAKITLRVSAGDLTQLLWDDLGTTHEEDFPSTFTIGQILGRAGKVALQLITAASVIIGIVLSVLKLTGRIPG